MTGLVLWLLARRAMRVAAEDAETDEFIDWVRSE
jgi:hypothetical protein